MSAFVKQAVESFQHLPVDMEHPIEAAAMLAVTAAALARVHTGFNRTEEKVTAESPNAALLETIATQTPDETRKTRLAPVRKLIAGTGLVLACIAGNPEYETTKVDSSSNAIVVQDVSNSMRLTRDLGKPGLSRGTAATQAIETANYQGKLGIIHTAAESKVVVPLSKDWRARPSKIEQAGIDTNGGQLSPALDLAASLLPPSPTVQNGHEGTVFLVTDGTVDDTPESVANEAAKLKRQGVDVKVVVAGTANGTYSLRPNTPPVSSKVQPELFSAFGGDNVHQAQTADQVTQTIRQELTDASTSRHKQSWYPPLVGAVVLFGVGLTKITRQHTSRWT